MSVTFCPRCGAKNDGESRYCAECGTPLNNLRSSEAWPDSGSAQSGTVETPANPAGAAPATNRKVKKSGTGAAFLALAGRYLFGFLLVALLAFLMNVFHQHSDFLTRGESIDMTEQVDFGSGAPVGEFVRVEAQFVLDAFATETNTMNGINSSEDSYYFVILNSGDAIAVKAASVNDRAVLDKGQEDTFDYLDEKLDYFDDIPLEGKLVRLTNTELIRYFDDYVTDLGLDDPDSTVRPQKFVLDMTAARTENVLLYIILPVGLVAAALIVVAVVRKRRAKNSV